MLTLHDVLRAIVRGESALLNDATWVERALAAITAHETGVAPAPPERAPAVPETTDAADDLAPQTADERASYAAWRASQAVPTATTGAGAAGTYTVAIGAPE